MEFGYHNMGDLYIVYLYCPYICVPTISVNTQNQTETNRLITQ